MVVVVHESPALFGVGLVALRLTALPAGAEGSPRQRLPKIAGKAVVSKETAVL